MQECFEQLAATTRDPTAQDRRTAPIVCAETFRGTVAGGGVCHLDAECISQTCNVTSCTDQSQCCPGMCVGDTPPTHQPAAIGQPCSVESHDPCVVGAYCTTNNQCAMLQPEGTGCFTNDQCDYGLGSTHSTSEPTLTCEVLPAPGQPCTDVCRDEGTTCGDPVPDCGAGGFALPGTTCVPVGTTGASCNVATDCSPFYQCDPVLHQCSATARLGQSSLDTTCFDADAYCDQASTTCMQLQDNGSPCLSDPQCKSGQCTTTGAIGKCTEITACI